MELFDNRTFVLRLKEAVQADKQETIASKAGYSQSQVSKYLRGSVEPPIAFIFFVAREYNVSIDWLLGIPGAQKTTDKATKELCGTLGLSEYAIASLSDEKQTYLRNAVNFLFDQHEIMDKTIDECFCSLSECKTFDELKKAESYQIMSNHNHPMYPLHAQSILFEIGKFADIQHSKTDFQLSVNEFGTLGLKYGTEESSQDYMIQTDIEGEQYDFVSTFNELKMTEITNNILSILNSYKNRKKDMLLNSPSIGVFSVSLTREARFAKIQQSIKNGEFVEDMEDSNDTTSET